MKVKIKKLCENAVIPSYAHDTDAGMDLVAASKKYDNHGNAVYGTGIAVEIPKGYVGLVFPRSSIYKMDHWLTNAVGVVDSGYRGEIKLKFACKNAIWWPKHILPRLRLLFGNLDKPLFRGLKEKNIIKSNYYTASGEYQVGDRIGQLIIMKYPQIEFEEVDELSDSERGARGYGSTGK